MKPFPAIAIGAAAACVAFTAAVAETHQDPRPGLAPAGSPEQVVGAIEQRSVDERLDKKLDEESTAAFRRGTAATRARRVVTAVPEQLAEGDFAYWVWVVGLESAVFERLKQCYPEFQRADDSLRASHLPKLFELAAEVSSGPAEPGVDGARALARSLAQTRDRALSALHASERRMIERCLNPENDPESPHLEEIEAMWRVREQEFDRGFTDTLPAARADIGRFAFEASQTRLSEAAGAVVRQCIEDAQPTLSELRRSHARAFASRLEAEARLKLAAVASARHGVALPAATAREWTESRDRARRQLAIAARRIGEANFAILDAMCAGVSDDDARWLHQEFAVRTYGSMAVDPWDIAPVAARARVELDPDAAGLWEEQYRAYCEESRSLQREVQRETDRYRQVALAQARTDLGQWERATKKIVILQTAQRALANRAAASQLALLPRGRQEFWEAEFAHAQEECERRARAQVEDLDRTFAGAPR